MDPTSGPAEGESATSIEPWSVIEEMRKNPRMPPDALAKTEEVLDMFERVGAAYADDLQVLDALKFAYAFGTVIGAYVATGDPKMLAIIDSLNQSSRAKAPRPRAWRAPAKELALTIRRDHPTLSQEKLAEKIHENWSSQAKCPSVETLSDFISELEQAGELPRRER